MRWVVTDACHAGRRVEEDICCRIEVRQKHWTWSWKTWVLSTALPWRLLWAVSSSPTRGLDASEMDEEHMPSSALKEVAENPSPGISVHSPFLLSPPFRYSCLGEKRGLHLMWPL